MTIFRPIFYAINLLLLAACMQETPPISAAEFMQDSRLLEATMVRCGRNRTELKYTADCMNARDAINRMEVREKRARHAELEVLSERKRQAVRQTQEAAEDSRRRQVEAQRLRDVAEYLGVSDDHAPNGTGLAQDSSPPFEIDQYAAGGEADIERVLLGTSWSSPLPVLLHTKRSAYGNGGAD